MSFNAGDPVSLKAMAQWLNSTGGASLNTSKDISAKDCFDFADGTAYVANPLGNFDFKEPFHFQAFQGASGGNPQVIDFDTADFGTLPTSTIHNAISGIGVPLYPGSTSAGSNLPISYIRNGVTINDTSGTYGRHHFIHIDAAYKLDPQYGWMSRLRLQMAGYTQIFFIDWANRQTLTNRSNGSFRFSPGSQRISAVASSINVFGFIGPDADLRIVTAKLEIDINCIVPDSNSSNSRQASLGCPYVCWRVRLVDMLDYQHQQNQLSRPVENYTANDVVSITAIDNVNSPITITPGVPIYPFYNNYTMFCHNYKGVNAKTYNPVRAGDNLPFFFEWDSSIT